mgnify:CR=1 FL=1
MDVHATNILNILKNFQGVLYEKNGINLIRISYKDYNKVEEILNFKIYGESPTTREESRTS